MVLSATRRLRDNSQCRKQKSQRGRKTQRPSNFRKRSGEGKTTWLELPFMLSVEVLATWALPHLTVFRNDLKWMWMISCLLHAKFEMICCMVSQKLDRNSWPRRQSEILDVKVHYFCEVSDGATEFIWNTGRSELLESELLVGNCSWSVLEEDMLARNHTSPLHRNLNYYSEALLIWISRHHKKSSGYPGSQNDKLSQKCSLYLFPTWNLRRGNKFRSAHEMFINTGTASITLAIFLNSCILNVTWTCRCPRTFSGVVVIMWHWIPVQLPQYNLHGVHDSMPITLFGIMLEMDKPQAQTAKWKECSHRRRQKMLKVMMMMAGNVRVTCVYLQ